MCNAPRLTWSWKQPKRKRSQRKAPRRSDKLQAPDGTEVEEKWKPAEKAAAVKVLDEKIKSLKEEIAKEKDKIQEHLRGSDARPTPNSEPMVWPMYNDGGDIRQEDYCTKLARLLSSFMAGREHLFPLPFQAINRLIYDYIPYGDNKSQFDHADLPFDDHQIPNLRADFEAQDKALFRLWETFCIPEYIKSMVLGGGIKHNMGAVPKEIYKVVPVSACS